MASAIVTELRCNLCGDVRPIEEFHRNERSSTGFDARCKPCRAQQTRDRYYADLHGSREYNREHQRRHRLRKAYGLTEDSWLAMLKQQDGCCAICGQKPENPRELRVDHDHRTGAVRELLCNNCNVILGMADDDVERLQKAITYLVSHRRLGATHGKEM